MDLEEDIIEEENEKEIIIQNEPDFNHDDSLLKTLKTTHKAPKGMYFDEDYFTDLVINKYLPTIKRDENGKIISSDKVLENEVLANILLVVNLSFSFLSTDRRRIIFFQPKATKQCFLRSHGHLHNSPHRRTPAAGHCHCGCRQVCRWNCPDCGT